MLNVLMPTDFTPASLKLVEAAVKNYDKKVNIILFHAFNLPDFSFDVSSYELRNPQLSLMTEQFRIACKQLKDNNSQIVNKVTVNCMQGNSKALFKNFIDANDIDFICCPLAYHFTPVHKLSVNPISLFKKAGVPLLQELNVSREYVFSQTNFVNNTGEMQLQRS